MIPVFPITLDCGEGHVLTDSIASVLPCLKRGMQERCLIYTMAHPDGLEIHGSVEEVASLWYCFLTTEEEDEQPDEVSEPD